MSDVLGMTSGEVSTAAPSSTALQLQAQTTDLQSGALESAATWPGLSCVRLRLHVQIAVPRMRVREVMALKPGMLLSSDVVETDDVAFGVVGLQLGWCEFSIVEDRIGIRLTRPA